MTRTCWIITMFACFASLVHGRQQDGDVNERSGGEQPTVANPAKDCRGVPHHCALFGLWPVANGIEHYCDFYENECIDIPTASFAVFDNYYDSYSCPEENCDGIAWGKNVTARTSNYVPHAPLLTKVPCKRLPDWVNRRIHELRAFPISFVPAGASRPVYMRVIEMLYLDEDNIKNSRSFIVGMEMVDPDGTQTVRDCTSKVQLVVEPHLYELKLGEEVVGSTNLGHRKILLIRAQDKSIAPANADK